VAGPLGGVGDAVGTVVGVAGVAGGDVELVGVSDDVLLTALALPAVAAGCDPRSTSTTTATTTASTAPAPNATSGRRPMPRGFAGDAGAA
jgi:hypothetical protein